MSAQKSQMPLEENQSFVIKNAQYIAYGCATLVLIILILAYNMYYNKPLPEKKVKFDDTTKKTNKEPAQADLEKNMKKEITDINNME
jgi:hypothetical protein